MRRWRLPWIRADMSDRVAYDRAQAEHAWREAEADPAQARRWLERAHRFTPSDPTLAFALATARLADGDPAAALPLYTRLADRHGGRELLAGIAACALALGDHAAARDALHRALSTTTPDATIAALAHRLGEPWCGLSDSGEVRGTLGRDAAFLLDGTPAVPERGRLPEGWRRARRLRAVTGEADHLGSPVDIAAILRTEGFVELVRGGIAGWAWHPGAPETDPVLTLIQGSTSRAFTATDLSVRLPGGTPLARPRGFAVKIGTGTALRVLGRDGRDLLGSPLKSLGGSRPPRRESASPTASTQNRDGGFGGGGTPHPTLPSRTAVIVPVYRGLAATLICLRSVLATLSPHDRLIVVDDASPDPALITAVQDMAAAGALTLLPSCPQDPRRNLGFPAAANAGLAAAAGADAVLLNSDTVVHPGWLHALRDAAHAAPDIGTATPLSNDATIFTYPDPANPAPLAADGAALAALALRVNAGLTVDVPTGHGFCLYIRAACLRQTGLLRAGLFAQGYGEENDFCERAAALGWRHVAAPAVYVGHVGGVSFGPARDHLLRRNAAILARLHPGYHGRVAAFIAADPLAPARRRLDEARLLAGAGTPALLLVSHAGQGGTARIVRERAQAARARGLRPLLLRGRDGITTLSPEDTDTPNLRFALPADQPALAALLNAARVTEVEIHHLLGHGDGIAALLAGLGAPIDVWVHDYNWICARLALVTGEAKFCGEPPAETCIACVARWGDAQEVPIDPPALRARSAALLAQARAVVTPSADVSQRIRRHFPAAPVREQAWEPDPPARPALLRTSAAAILTVAVVGAIGMEKGYDLLLACARDAASRALPLRFAVIGYTIDDTPLLATGHAFATGPFQREEAPGLIAAAGAQLAFLPSVWPETWCFALSDIWDAGLDAAVFDIGTPALRVRRTGRGWVLPLGLPPARVNGALLNLQGLASRSAS
jgi:GT2 family glycosyltransferase